MQYGSKYKVSSTLLIIYDDCEANHNLINRSNAVLGSKAAEAAGPTAEGSLG